VDEAARGERRVRIEPFAEGHLDGVVALCAALGWTSWTRERAARALAAPGTTALVAVEGGSVIGVAHLLSDGEINAYLSTLAVDERHRRAGVGRRLVDELFARTSAPRIDLLSTPDAMPFYRSFAHREKPGFRLHPADVS
jgi:ribosomal protein S18 acetylase RimI-like enzyme